MPNNLPGSLSLAFFFVVFVFLSVVPSPHQSLKNSSDKMPLQLQYLSLSYQTFFPSSRFFQEWTMEQVQLDDEMGLIRILLESVPASQPASVALGGFGGAASSRLSRLTYRLNSPFFCLFFALFNSKIKFLRNVVVWSYCTVARLLAEQSRDPAMIIDYLKSVSQATGKAVVLIVGNDRTISTAVELRLL